MSITTRSPFLISSSSSSLFLSVTFLLLNITSLLLLATSSAFADQQQQQPVTIDATKCRELGFASAGSSQPPNCGTCDVLAELLKASPEEKKGQTPEQRKDTIALKKQMIAECRSCCSPGYFDQESDHDKEKRLNAAIQASGGAAAGGSGSIPSSFVSAILELDETLANSNAHPISKFIKNYGSQWDSSKFRVKYTSLVSPRLLLKREDGKEDMMNIGGWEPELVWTFLRKNMKS